MQDTYLAQNKLKEAIDALKHYGVPPGRMRLLEGINEIIRCKMPQLAVIDASEKGFILAGQSLEMDKQAAKVLGREWKAIEHLKIADERFQEVEKKTPQQKV